MRPPIAGLVATLGLTAFTALGAVTPAAAAPPPNAAGLLQSALNAAQQSGSVHMVDQSKSGGQTQKLEGALSAPAAAETLTQGAALPLQVELIGGTVYVNGGASSLTNALQITAAQAAPVAGKWIAVSSNDAPFQLLTADLTISSALSEFTPKAKGLRLGKTKTVSGHRVIPIIGTPTSATKGTTGSVALFVSTKGSHLPLGGSLVMGNKTGRLNEVAVFNSWGTPVALTAPTTTVPFSSVLAG